MGTREYQENKTNNKEYKIPAVIRNETREISLGKALFISAVAHPLIVGLFWLLFKLLVLLLAILGITLPLFDKPQTKIRDLEFVLVTKPEQKPIDPNTKYRAEKIQERAVNMIPQSLFQSLNLRLQNLLSKGQAPLLLKLSLKNNNLKSSNSKSKPPLLNRSRLLFRQDLFRRKPRQDPARLRLTLFLCLFQNLKIRMFHPL
ncbi:MAG: hypothetical protein MZU91_05890 [Desulfosudis oleivorans]|nr:hypothetical protein [Desulfosudis oleivorans]